MSHLSTFVIRAASPGDMDALLELCAEHAAYEGAPCDPQGKVVIDLNVRHQTSLRSFCVEHSGQLPPPSLERVWLLFVGDDSVQRWISDPGHLAAYLLESLAAHGRLEVLRRLPLRDIDESKPGLWVQTLMESGGEEARCLPQVLGGFLPPFEELLLLALLDLKWIDQNNGRHDVAPFLGIIDERSAISSRVTCNERSALFLRSHHGTFSPQ
jgi:hypothetical protein